jgi:hypothetical protein
MDVCAINRPYEVVLHRRELSLQHLRALEHEPIAAVSFGVDVIEAGDELFGVGSVHSAWSCGRE